MQMYTFIQKITDFNNRIFTSIVKLITDFSDRDGKEVLCEKCENLALCDQFTLLIA